MNIQLREITKQNWRETARLKVAPGQENFVAANVYSIAQSRFYPSFVTLAIYDSETMVGFLMHGLNEDDQDGKRWIIRLMVDQQYQGRGYGRAAMELIIRQLRQEIGGDELYISYEPENVLAAKLYKSLGFVETGEIDDGELVALLKF